MTASTRLVPRRGDRRHEAAARARPMPAASCCAWSPRRSRCPTARRTSGTGCCGRSRRWSRGRRSSEEESARSEPVSAACWRAAPGRIRISVQVPGWQDFPLQDWLEQTFHLPALVANDTVAGGYAELCRGAGVDARHFFYSNIGSGIGGACFSIACPTTDWAWAPPTWVTPTCPTGPPMWRAAKTSSRTSAPAGPSKGACGRRATSPAQSQLMAMCQGEVSSLTCAMLGEAARSGDTFAAAEIDRIARSYAIALSNLITLVSPDVVAIGGGVANLGDVLLDPIRRFTDERVFISAQGALPHRAVRLSWTRRCRSAPHCWPGPWDELPAVLTRTAGIPRSSGRRWLR